MANIEADSACSSGGQRLINSKTSRTPIPTSLPTPSSYGMIPSRPLTKEGILCPAPNDHLLQQVAWVGGGCRTIETHATQQQGMVLSTKVVYVQTQKRRRVWK